MYGTDLDADHPGLKLNIYFRSMVFFSYLILPLLLEMQSNNQRKIMLSVLVIRNTFHCLLCNG